MVSYRDNIRKIEKNNGWKKHKMEKKHNSPITARIHTRHWQSQCRAEKSHPTTTKTSQGRNPRPKPEETHKTNYPRPKPLIRGLKIHTKKSTKKHEKRSFKRTLSARHRKTLRQPGVAPKNGSRTALIVWFSCALLLDWPVVQPDLARDHQQKKRRTRHFGKLAIKNKNCDYGNYAGLVLINGTSASVFL